MQTPPVDGRGSRGRHRRTVLAHRMGRTKSIRNLGQGAYQTNGGWVVVRKDRKILTVDISRLPAQFGVPPTSRSDVGVPVADVILACWAGD
jgi:hypothetical protein